MLACCAQLGRAACENGAKTATADRLVVVRSCRQNVYNSCAGECIIFNVTRV
jgi:hypothetical protein